MDHEDRVYIGAASTEAELATWVTQARHIADHTAPDVRVKALRDAVLAFYDACKFSNVQINLAERKTLTQMLTQMLTQLVNLYYDTFARMHRPPQDTTPLDTL